MGRRDIAQVADTAFSTNLIIIYGYGAVNFLNVFFPGQSVTLVVLGMNNVNDDNLVI